MEKPRSDLQDMVSRLAFKANTTIPGYALGGYVRISAKSISIKGNDGTALLNADQREISIPGSFRMNGLV